MAMGENVGQVWERIILNSDSVKNLKFSGNIIRDTINLPRQVLGQPRREAVKA